MFTYTLDSMNFPSLSNKSTLFTLSIIGSGYLAYRYGEYRLTDVKNLLSGFVYKRPSLDKSTSTEDSDIEES